MSRWILLIVVALVVTYLIDSQAKRLRRRLDDLRGAVRPGNPTRPAQVHTVGELVACARCGVHVLKQRSLADGSRRFCSEACRERSATTRS